MFGRKKIDTTIEVPQRKVLRQENGLYVVKERQDNGQWSTVSPEYHHSTSCYAALGRMTHTALTLNNLNKETK